jgi:curved DNA-binding protein CbpA
VNEAFDALSDPDKRRKYDSKLDPSRASGVPHALVLEPLPAALQPLQPRACSLTAAPFTARLLGAGGGESSVDEDVWERWARHNTWRETHTYAWTEEERRRRKAEFAQHEATFFRRQKGDAAQDKVGVNATGAATPLRTLSLLSSPTSHMSSRRLHKHQERALTAVSWAHS